MLLNSVTALITLHLKGLANGNFEFRIMNKRTRVVIQDSANHYIIKYFDNNKLKSFTFNTKFGKLMKTVFRQLISDTHAQDI
jgi:hypothetical protein